MRVVAANLYVFNRKIEQAVDRLAELTADAEDGRWVILACEAHRFHRQLGRLGKVYGVPWDGTKEGRGRSECVVLVGPGVDVESSDTYQLTRRLTGSKAADKFWPDRWATQVVTSDGWVFTSYHGNAVVQSRITGRPLDNAGAREYAKGMTILAARTAEHVAAGRAVVVGGDGNYRDRPPLPAWAPQVALPAAGAGEWHGRGVDFVASSEQIRLRRVVKKPPGADHPWLLAGIRERGPVVLDGFMPGVIVKNIPPGSNDPRIKPVGGVCHVAVSESDSLYPFFNGPSGGIESHFYIRRDGKIEQYRSIYYEADANYKGNSFDRGGTLCGLLSIETQGMGPGEWTSEQLASIKAIMTWANEEAGVPLQVIEKWNGDGWGYHIQFGTPGPWTPSVKSCPGPDRIVQFKKVLAPWLEAGGRDPEPKVTRVEKSRALVQQGIDGLNETPEPRKGAKRLAAALAAVLADVQYPTK